EKILKVILETAYLTDEEIARTCKVCADAGADYVKTSTGFAPTGATVAHVRLMRASVPDTVGIKASGGIRTLEQARAMIEAGADRIGTSAGVSLMESWHKV
ncbi:MAG: deoxyribose-phosphate aldolase, partial [Bacteroidetes bacterium]